jgi:tRNA A-37 threonylcarbamoyl transferase component Bud32
LLQDAIDCGWLRESRSCVSGEVDMLAVMATTAEVAAAMLLLHRAGIVHGDLSAANVLLSR